MVSAALALNLSIGVSLINLILMSVITHFVRKANSSVYTGKVKGMVAGSLIFIIVSLLSLGGGLFMMMKDNGFKHAPKILIACALMGFASLILVLNLADEFKLNDKCRVCKGDALDKDIDSVYNNKLKWTIYGFYACQTASIAMCGYFATNLN